MDLSLPLAKIFPLTLSLLPAEEKKSLQVEFEQEFGEEKMHFFPMLLRQRKLNPQWVEVANYEFQKYQLKACCFSEVTKQMNFVLNPSLQFVWIEQAASFLQKAPGLYVLWKWDNVEFERQISKEEAAVLDQLQDDQVFSIQKLNESEKSNLEALISLHIVFENIR